MRDSKQHAEYTRKWRLRNKEHIKAYNKIRKDKGIIYDNGRKLHYKVKYNITLKEYDELFAKQQGRCAICHTHQDNLKIILSVDHCHATGNIRGLLCKRCNNGIGYFLDNIDLLKNAINYLDS